MNKTQPNPVAFLLGDSVSWTSQAGGFAKTKTGVVAQVVPAKSYPDRDRFKTLYTQSGVSMARDVESYVILVGNKPYWPLPKRLSAAKS